MVSPDCRKERHTERHMERLNKRHNNATIIAPRHVQNIQSRIIQIHLHSRTPIKLTIPTTLTTYYTARRRPIPQAILKLLVPKTTHQKNLRAQKIENAGGRLVAADKSCLVGTIDPSAENRLRSRSYQTPAHRLHSLKTHGGKDRCARVNLSTRPRTSQYGVYLPNFQKKLKAQPPRLFWLHQKSPFLITDRIRYVTNQNHSHTSNHPSLQPRLRNNPYLPVFFPLSSFPDVSSPFECLPNRATQPS